MKQTLLLALLTFQLRADPPPLPSSPTNAPSGTNTVVLRPPTQIVRHGVHVLFDWNRATNAVNLQSPVVSVVLTNNQAEWSTNMIGNTNGWARGEIYGYGLWVVCLWLDPNATNREYQYKINLNQTNWVSLGSASNANPRFPDYLSTLVRLPPFPPDTDRMFFRLRRKDSGL